MLLPIIAVLLAEIIFGVLLWRLAPHSQDRFEYTVTGVVFGPLALLMPLGDYLAARDRARPATSPSSSAGTNP